MLCWTIANKSIISWNKIATQTLHSYCIDHAMNETVDVPDTTEFCIIFVRNPIDRWLSGFIEYKLWTQQQGNVKDLTNNFTHFCFDEHTDLIYTTARARKAFGLPHISVDFRLIHCLPSLLGYNDKIPHLNSKGGDDKKIIRDLYNTNKVFKNNLNSYLKDDIDFYIQEGIHSDEQTLQRYYFA